MVSQILGILRLILNPKTLLSIVIIFLVGLGIYNYVVPPKHCVENTDEVKNILKVYAVEFSQSDKGQSKICFRSRDEKLVSEIANRSQQAYLQLELEKIKGRQAWWDKYGLVVVIAGIVAACITTIAIALIYSRRGNHSF